MQRSSSVVIDAPQGTVPFIDYGPDLGPKSFGPKAVLTPGKLGIYEQVAVSQSGPGK